MKKYKTNQILEFLSPSLIISYFFIHNIFLVLIGIIFSLYLINVDNINSIKRFINKILLFNIVLKDSNENDNKRNSSSTDIKSIKKEIKPTLAEEIEELGFIPSIQKRNNTNEV